MENTIENKARFFAQYYGQKITFIDAVNNPIFLNPQLELF